MTKELQNWGDAQQYLSAPMQAPYDPTTGVMPRVELVWMTPDPLGAIAAACRMYEGKPTYSLGDVTDEERRHYWAQAQATHLKAPLEFVKFHFFIEGVDRAFTHQMVRQRTAVYAQESMRFAVMDDNLLEHTSLPPSLHGTQPADERVDYSRESDAQRWRATWDNSLRQIDQAYQRLVNSGMPAEEARGLLPHATATRLNYATDLRALLDHAGNRLCTQAQFHWRLVFGQIAKSIGAYPWEEAKRSFSKQTGGHPDDIPISPHDLSDNWQFEALAKVFRPVCYELGRCPFKATFDRNCSIRDRVDANAAIGRPSKEWDQDACENDGNTVRVGAIDPREWMADPTAARRRNE